MSCTLIFLHGGPGFRDYLRPYFTQLEKRFECVFYDQVRGTAVTMQDMVSELHSVVQKASNKVVLVGHSWGGVLATQYASIHEDKLTGLVLMSTGLKASQWRDEFRAELRNLGLEDAPPEKIFLTLPELDIGRPLLDATWESFSEETFDHLFSTYLSNYDLTENFRKLQIPVLNIFGERDVRFPLRVTTSFKQIKKDIIELELPNTGHFPFLLPENRTQISKLIEETFG
ncbi:MAG TPA: alpha/beta hydrolase [Bdellovibrio sp.]|uniref:alpha/beta fold hydrolase n=1 Tax=Bdellovibrio sp. TaxID=28201 RepID=UPI002EE19DF3